jgi:hypothetical protein
LRILNCGAMSYSNRIFMYGPVALLLTIAILYSVFWRVQADTLAARLNRANGGELIPGVSFSFAQKTVGGFPFRLDVLLSGVSFGYHSGGAELDWRSDRIAMHRLSYNSGQFIFEADGMQSFTWTAGQDSRPITVSLMPDTARASAILSAGRLVRVDLDIWRPRGTEQNTQQPEVEFSADRAQFHALARRNDTLDLVLQIDNARAGAAAAPALLQAAFSLIDCRATIDHAGSLLGLENGTEAVAGALQQWRAQQGMIDVTSLAVNWPDTRANLRGKLTLDSDDHLSGTLRGEQMGEKNNTHDIQLEFTNGTAKFAGAAAHANP